jgi:hypothetical protein
LIYVKYNFYTLKEVDRIFGRHSARKMPFGPVTQHSARTAVSAGRTALDRRPLPVANMASNWLELALAPLE